MMNITIEILSTLVLSIGEILSWKNISGKKVNYKSIKTYLVLLLLILVQILNYHFVNDFIKSVGVMIVFVIGCKFVLNVDLKKSLILSFLSELLIIICEAIFVFLASFIFTVDYINNNINVTFFADIFIGVFISLLSKINILKKLYCFIDKITGFIKVYQILLFLTLVMLSSSTIFAYIYLDKNIPLILLINSLISIMYTIIIILVFNYQNRYYRTNLKYKNSLESLCSKESIIEDYRIMNHENNNQLLTIKSMTKENQVKNYIDSLIDQKNKFKSEIIDNSLKLPEGGIRGLIYTKLLYMKNNNIKYNLNVDNKINAKIFAGIGDNDTVDICQILGVFIDNAIEEVSNLDNKVININLYIERNNLVITISNYYNSKIIVNKKGTEFQTTKGKKRGYGLKLVKKIVLSNKKIRNETDITKNIFTQKVLIRIENKL